MSENGKLCLEGDLDYKDMGEIVRQIRAGHLKITHEELADLIETPVKHIERAEQGNVALAPSVLKKICAQAGLKLSIRVEIKTPESIEA